MTLINVIENTVEKYPEACALQHSGGIITYKVLYDAILRLANGLQNLGLGRSERAAVMLPNIPHFAMVYHAIMRLGAVVVPFNTMLKGREIAALLDECEARTFITLQTIYKDCSTYVNLIRSLRNVILLGEETPKNAVNLTRLMAKSTPLFDVAPVDESDIAVVNYTAGETGRPKGAELAHSNLLSNTSACAEIFNIEPNDVLYAALPFFTPMGQTLLLNQAILSGAALYLVPKFDPSETAKHICQGKSTVFIGTPSMFKIVLYVAAGYEVEKPLRLCICGNGQLDEDTIKGFEKRFATHILECYTAAETSPVIAVNKWRSGRRIGSLGHPLPGVEMKIVDERNRELHIGATGEIIVKGPNVMKGYLNRPTLTSLVLHDGWFYTGDLGKMDINGFFYLVDRLYDRIMKGGFTIYPYEIETLLKCHPDVSDAAVVGIQETPYDQELKACIVLKSSSNISTEQIAAYCLEHLALYKVPKVVRFYKELPRQDDGQLNREELKREIK